MPSSCITLPCVGYVFQMPFAFVALRNAGVLTSFLIHTPAILTGIESCDTLRVHLSSLAGNQVTFERYKNRPLIYMIFSFVVIVLFEAYEWSVWFGTGDGEAMIWDFRPFPFTLTQFHYGCLWWAFTSIPFLLAQFALCFPVFFAYILRRFVRFVNKELVLLAKAAAEDRMDRCLDALGSRVTQLRAAHFAIAQLTSQLDKAVNRMLLIQFMCDIVILFGFVGLLINAKDARPTVELLEWTFYIPASFTWYFFFLFQFSFPMVHLSEEVWLSYNYIFFYAFNNCKETSSDEILRRKLHFYKNWLVPGLRYYF